MQHAPGILEEFEQWDEQLRREYIEAEITENRDVPYATVVRHFFEKLP
jgi:hypothetical protein